jgi:hypothetical protein
MRALVVLLAVFALRAQDTRNVAEPHFPDTCTVLSAEQDVLTTESASDTARIQSAMDACPKGRAVALRVSGSHNIFVGQRLRLQPLPSDRCPRCGARLAGTSLASLRYRDLPRYSDGQALPRRRRWLGPHNAPLCGLPGSGCVAGCNRPIPKRAQETGTLKRND